MASTNEAGLSWTSSGLDFLLGLDRADALAGLGADAVVVTPAHQYPLGVTLGPRRRAELIAWASASAGILIVELGPDPMAQVPLRFRHGHQQQQRSGQLELSGFGWP